MRTLAVLFIEARRYGIGLKETTKCGILAGTVFSETSPVSENKLKKINKYIRKHS